MLPQQPRAPTLSWLPGRGLGHAGFLFSLVNLFPGASEASHRARGPVGRALVVVCDSRQQTLVTVRARGACQHA